MITPEDINFFKQSRDDMTTNRMKSITLIARLQVGEDRYTKQPIYEDVNHACMAVVTEISGTSGVAIERKLDNGMKVIDGDIQFSVSLEYIDEVLDKYERITYNGERYVILAADYKGIGERNRVEFLARVAK